MVKVKKILFVSIPSVHFIRWISQLKDENFQLYFYNIRNIKSGYVLPNNCKEITIPSIRPFKGEGFIKKRSHKIYQLLDDTISSQSKLSFEKILIKIKPDVVHAFELNTSAYPILSVMNRYTKIPFVYTIWGNDMYYFKRFKSHEFKILEVLKRVNYLFTDCDRDLHLARKFNFKGEYLGNYPGGGGYRIDKNEILNFSDKENIILIKGYENQFGRGINVLKSLLNIKENLKGYEIVFFSAQEVLIEYYHSQEIFKKLDIKFLSKNEKLEHNEMLMLFNKSKIYIGNSISDGMPNTLLEALVMGCFPIQSNPGGATAEIIINGKNGFLIENPNNISEISNHIKNAISNINLLEKAYFFNTNKFNKELEFELIKKQVINSYKKISTNVS